MQSALESSLFRALTNSDSTVSIAHSSISKRLNTVRYQYVTMIAAILLTHYKKDKKLEGYKIVKENLHRI